MSGSKRTIRTKRSSVDMTVEEWELVDRLASYEGRMSRNATLRFAVLESARARGLIVGGLPFPPPVVEDEERNE